MSKQISEAVSDALNLLREEMQEQVNQLEDRIIDLEANVRKLRLESEISNEP